MKLKIDGHVITAKPDETLLDLARRLGLLTEKLSDTPLVAKIAGEIFTLYYVPVRRKDIYERESMRRAMAASEGTVRLLR